ncbi:hypothetical protein ACOME3_000831 [Neoechinorhynchus agilis]
MEIIKDLWINHGGLSLYSLDIDGTDSYVATAGLLDDNGCVTVWNFPGMRGDRSNTKPMFRGCCHLGCVNAVRWQPPSGFCFATGGADGLVNIWTHLGTEAQWERSTVLKGHSGDVLGVEWFPAIDESRSEILATCSVDCRVFVWNVERQELIVKLIGHTGIVKGVSWDPVGRYLVSQSDDRSMILWRTLDWSIEGTFKKSFESNPTDSHFLITNRENVNTEISLVGHSDITQVVRFSPRTYNHGRTLFAIAGRDCSLSIWMSDLSKPLFVATNLFLSAIVDISWTTDGQSLMACSLDGTSCRIVLDAKALFEQVDPLTDVEVAISKGFGARHNLNKAARAIGKSGLIDPKPKHHKPMKAINNSNLTDKAKRSKEEPLDLVFISKESGIECKVTKTRYGFVVSYGDIWTRLIPCVTQSPIALCSNRQLTHVLTSSGILYSFESCSNGKQATVPFLASSGSLCSKKPIHIQSVDRVVFVSTDQECWIYTINKDQSLDRIASGPLTLPLTTGFPPQFTMENGVVCLQTNGVKFRLCQRTMTWRLNEDDTTSNLTDELESVRTMAAADSTFPIECLKSTCIECFRKCKAVLNIIDEPTFDEEYQDVTSIREAVEKYRTLLDQKLFENHLAAMALKSPIRVAVTGAAGQIGYSLVYMIGSGYVFGEDQPIILHLIELKVAMEALKGVVMELQDAVLPLLHDIIATDSLDVGFKDVDAVFLVGSMPRKAGMERKDLLSANVKIFKTQGEALEKYAKKTVKVLVVGNPANTNALICSKFAPSIPVQNITAMTRLDQNRCLGLLAEKLKLNVNDVRNAIVWGNHSVTMFPDTFHGHVRQDGKWVPINNAVNDIDWIKGDFVTTIQKRGAAIIAARKLSSALSAAKAASDHMRDWWRGTEEGKWVSMAVPTDGSYGIKEGLVFSLPCTVDKHGNYKIVQGLDLNSYAMKMLANTTKELEEEKAVALEACEE